MEKLCEYCGWPKRGETCDCFKIVPTDPDFDEIRDLPLPFRNGSRIVFGGARRNGGNLRSLMVEQGRRWGRSNAIRAISTAEAVDRAAEQLFERPEPAPDIFWVGSAYYQQMLAHFNSPLPLMTRIANE